MSNSHDEKKDGKRKDKKTHEMHEHEAEVHHKPHTHNPAADVGVVTSNSSTHEHGLQNKEVHKEILKAVDIHSDDKDQRHTHVPKDEQLAHDFKEEESHKHNNTERTSKDRARA